MSPSLTSVTGLLFLCPKSFLYVLFAVLRMFSPSHLSCSFYFILLFYLFMKHKSFLYLRSYTVVPYWMLLSFQVSEKKRGKASHPQDLVKEVRLSNNTPDTWTRPRCGVPDYPAQTKQFWQRQHRQRRFVLHGGRMDKTDLTYRYGAAHTHILSSDHPTLWPHHTCPQFLMQFEIKETQTFLCFCNILQLACTSAFNTI